VVGPHRVPASACVYQLLLAAVEQAGESEAGWLERCLSFSKAHIASSTLCLFLPCDTHKCNGRGDYKS
jgi:hypothetical protein